MYTADTGLTERFWELAREESGIEFIIADVSFPNRLEKLAMKSGHMTLSMLIHCLERFGLGHMKSIHNPHEAYLSQGNPF